MEWIPRTVTEATPMSDIVQADRSTFRDEVHEASNPVVVEFYTDWCETCQELEPVLEELAETYDGAIKVVTVDLDEEGRLANELHIADVPTLIGYHRGNSLKRRSGTLAADDVEAMFEFLASLPRVAA